MKDAVVISGPGADWAGVLSTLTESGVLRPVLWIGRPAERPDLPGAPEFLDAADLRIGRLPAEPAYGGAFPEFLATDAHRRTRAAAILAMETADIEGRRRNVARTLLAEALVLLALERIARLDPDLLLLAGPAASPEALVFREIFRHLGREIVTAEPLAPLSLVALRREEGLLPRDGGSAPLAADLALPEARFLPPDLPDAPRRAPLWRRPVDALTAPLRRAIARRWSVDPDPGDITRNVFREDAVPARFGAGRIALLRNARARRAAGAAATAPPFPEGAAEVHLPGPAAGPVPDLLARVAEFRALLPPPRAVVVHEAPGQFAAAGTGVMTRAPATWRLLAEITGVLVARPGPPPEEGPGLALAFDAATALRLAVLGRHVLIADPGWLAGAPGVTAFPPGAALPPEAPPPPGAVAAWLGETAAAHALDPADTGALAATLARALA